MSGYRTEAEVWEYPPRWKRGDLALAVLDTQPWVVVALARLGQNNANVMAVEDSAPFAPMLITALRARMSMPLSAVTATLDENVADELLAALAAEFAAPAPAKVREGRRSMSSCRQRSSGPQAIALSMSEGRCTACERDYGALLEGGAGMAGLDVHHLDALARSETETVGTTVDRLAVVCGGCHAVLHSAKLLVSELRYAWRPAYPACGARCAQQLLYGLLAEPAGDGQIAAGCDATGNNPGWRCGDCGHIW